MGDYTPELGQMLFGQPSQQYGVPPIMAAALDYIDGEYCRIWWNEHQRECPSPFGNNGPGANLKNEVFEVQAYSWGEDEQPYNFAWRDLRISWYKCCGRGMSANLEITPDMAAECLDDCLAALSAMEPPHDPP